MFLSVCGTQAKSEKGKNLDTPTTQKKQKRQTVKKDNNKNRKEMFSFASVIAAPMASSTGVSIGMRTKRNAACSSSGGNRAAVYASAARLSSKRNCFRPALSVRDRGKGRSEGRRKERMNTRPRATLNRRRTKTMTTTANILPEPVSWKVGKASCF